MGVGTSPRSRLYHFAPLGAGTPFVECLTSYINRLAWAYRVGSRRLVTEAVVPNLGRSHYLQQSLAHVHTFCRFEAMRINGAEEIAVDWADTLGRLTRRSDLRFLTLHNWARGLPNQGLLRAAPAWCPECYHEWREAGLPLYQPLTWMLQATTICTGHSRCLEEHCPRCGKSQYTLTKNSLQPGFCTQCASWLGSSSQPATFPEIDIEVFSQQRWVLDTIEELQRFGVRTGAVPWERFSIGLTACIDAVGANKRLARITALSPQLLASWRTLKSMPSFKQMLQLCYALDVSPLRILLTEPDTLKKDICGRHVSRRPTPERPSRPHIARERVKQVVLAALDERNAPPSLNEVARRLRVSVKTLSYHFPQECSLIAARYRAYRTELAKQRTEQKRSEVRQVVRTLHEQDIYPSYDRVKANLSDPNVMRRPEGQAAWHAARRELGIET